MHTITKRLASLIYLVRPLLLIFVGIVLLSLSVTSLFIWAYRGIRMPDVFYYLMLQFMPGPIRGIVLLLLGLGVLAAGIWHLSGIVVFRLHENELDENEIILGYRREQHLPRIVVLSGGPGMLILTQLGEHVERLTCITPIQDPVEYYYRASSLFNTQNVYYVVPSPTPTNVIATLDNEQQTNIMQVTNNPAFAQHYVTQLQLVPKDQTGTQDSYPLSRLAKEALSDADAIVLGPGSLFESILPNLLIDDLRTAIQQSKALKIYVCNLMTEPGLTAGFSVADHIRQIREYGGFTPDYVLVNAQRIEEEVQQLYANAHQRPVYLTPEEYEETTVLHKGLSRRHLLVEDSVVIEADLASSVIQYSAKLDNPAEKMAVRVLRHDPQKLIAALLKLLKRD